MQKPYHYLLTAIAGGVLAFGAFSTASANTVNDTSLAHPGVYYGTGNSGLNTGWAVTTSGPYEIGLSTNLRYHGQVAPDAGTNVYHVSTGVDTGSDFCGGICSLWNFEFSVSLGDSGTTLGNVKTNMTITNVGNGQSFSFDPYSEFSDNAAWAGGTSRPRGGSTPTPPLSSTDVGFQNSENLGFGPLLSPSGFVPASFAFDPNANDTYLVSLSLTDSSGLNMSANEKIIAGLGATPIPATLPLFLSGIGLFGLIMYRRKKGAAPSGLAAA